MNLALMFALALGIDYALLVPILLRLTGTKAWYFPKWLDRSLPNVAFGH